ncbi:MAG: hypothetical protein RJA61_637 [Candidatus Parcubacteria bacterium]|jgi:Tfp pilus assembly protein PilO
MKTILPLILIALAVGTYYTYIAPQYDAVMVLRAQEVVYKEAQEKSVKLVSVYDRLATEYNNLSQDNLNKLNAFLPDSFDQTRFVMDLDGLASKYGIKIRDISVSTPDSATAPESVPFRTHLVTFKFKSPYQNFAQFTEDIGKSLRIMDLTRVNFVSTETGVYEFTATVQTYSLSK